MSIRSILWALEQRVGSSPRKLVLIKLADNANDDGSCWPSMAYLAAHCEMTRKSIHTHIKALERDGFVEVERRSQDGVSLPNRYRLRVSQGATEGVGKNLHHPCNQGQGVGKNLHTEPVIEPTSVSKGARVDWRPLVSMVGEDLAGEWQRHRKAMKAPVTGQTVVTRICSALEECSRAGIEPREALSESIERGWRTIKAEWIKNDRSRNHEKGQRVDQRSRTQRVADTLDAIIREGADAPAMGSGSVPEASSPVREPLDGCYRGNREGGGR